MSSNYHHSNSQFLKSFKWNLWGGFIYEGLKISHQLLLFKNLPLLLYGQVGIVFSLIFLAIQLFGLAADKSLSPFIGELLNSQENIKKYILPYLIFQIPLLLIGGIAYKILATSKIASTQALPFWIPVLIILFEGLRTTLRALLHNLFINKATMATETFLMLVYTSSIWIPFYIYNENLTIKIIFFRYLIISILATLILSILFIKYYLTKPKTAATPSSNIVIRIIKTRFFNYSTNLTQYFFSGNFLVPFFGAKFGFEKAGIFKLASYLADAIKSIIHIIAGFSGGALFASLKQASKKEKIAAFYTLNQKIINILFFILIFLIINYKALFKVTQNQIYNTNMILAFIAFFLLFVFSKHIFAAYEQFYITEELTSKLFLFKSLELLLLFFVIYFSKNLSTMITLQGLIIIRIISFVILAINAYTIWKIKPNFKIKLNFLFLTLLISFVFKILISLF